MPPLPQPQANPYGWQAEVYMSPNQFICIGAAHWDIIGRSDTTMGFGADVPGRVSRQMGGVALNVALALARQNQNVTILTAIGNDQAGNDLMAAMRTAGLNCADVIRANIQTDTYLAIESKGELFGAVADCAALEHAGTSILGNLNNLSGKIILDGNLPENVFAAMTGSNHILVPASPAKSPRLRAALRPKRAAIYCNRHEAEMLCQTEFADATEAVSALVKLGAVRATVTDGSRLVADHDGTNLVNAMPKNLNPTSATGAGDTFLASHLVALNNGFDPQSALNHAVAAAATHIARVI